MDDQNQNIPENGMDQDQIISRLRRVAAEREGASPVVERDLWAPREISSRRSVWIVRVSTLFFALIFLSEIWFLVQQQPQERAFTGFEGGPAVEVVAAPVVQAPMPAPPVEGAENVVEPPAEEYPVPPTPTPPPVPDEIKDIDLNASNS